MNNIISVSCGNDSVAMLRWIVENRQHFPKNDKFIAVYSNTGWAVSWWQERVDIVKQYCSDNDIEFNEVVPKVDFAQLVKDKNMFPHQSRRFCTKELKVKPIIKWRLENNYTPNNSTIFIGVRAEESKARENTTSIGVRDGLDAVYPLAYVKEQERDNYIKRAGIKVLKHRSSECHPCIFDTSKQKINRIEPEKVLIINDLERGITKHRNDKRKKDKDPKYNANEVWGFYSSRNLNIKTGAGIMEQRKWALTSRGRYNDKQPDIFACDNDYCSG